jgi:hypothetical protein
MLVAHYIGPAKPGLAAWIGWHLTVLAQKSPFDLCTHTEAIHAVHEDGSVTIASASLADKGVRLKERVKLNPEHWIITDVPQWDVSKSVTWFQQAIKDGLEYDKRGALATMLPGRQNSKKVFCTEAVLAPFMQAPHYYTPSLCLDLCLSIGQIQKSESKK